MGPEGLRALDGDLLATLRREALHLAVEVVPTAPGEPGASQTPLEAVIECLDAAEGSERAALVEAARALLSEPQPEGAPRDDAPDGDDGSPGGGSAEPPSHGSTRP